MRCTHRGSAWPWSWPTRCRAPGRAGATRVTACSPLVSVGLGLAILVAVNYVASRQNKRWDLTANQQFTLSEQTTKLLQGLTAPVKLLVFDRPTGFERFRDRLTSYEYASKNVSVEYIDADKYPVRAPGVRDRSSTARWSSSTWAARSASPRDAEQDITNALIKAGEPGQEEGLLPRAATARRTPTSPADERRDTTAITDALRRDNYEFDTLVLAQANAVPADATVPVEAGPRTDLLERELPRIEAYLAKGGQAAGAPRSSRRSARRRTRRRASPACSPSGASRRPTRSCDAERPHQRSVQPARGAALSDASDHRPTSVC